MSADCWLESMLLCGLATTRIPDAFHPWKHYRRQIAEGEPSVFQMGRQGLNVGSLVLTNNYIDIGRTNKEKQGSQE